MIVLQFVPDSRQDATQIINDLKKYLGWNLYRGDTHSDVLFIGIIFMTN